MLKLGSPVIDPEGNTGTVERNSRKTDVHMVRCHEPLPGLLATRERRQRLAAAGPDQPMLV